MLFAKQSNRVLGLPKRYNDFEKHNINRQKIEFSNFYS